MPRIDFDRHDFCIVLSCTADGGVLVSAGPEDAQQQRRLKPRALEQWAELPPEDRTLNLRRVLGLGREVEEWFANYTRRPQKPDEHPIPRVVLDLRLGEQLAGLDWEGGLAFNVGDVGGPAITRVSQVRPRVAARPLTLPIRILHLDPPTDFDLRQRIMQVFGTRPAREVAEAVRVAESRSKEFAKWLAPPRWPTVDVLFLEAIASVASGERLLSTVCPEVPGTLGWLIRATDVWQTRLVLLNCQSREEWPIARRLADQLAARGGPAVIAVELRGTPGRQWVGAFFDRLVHDFPLDDTLRWLAQPKTARGESSSLVAVLGSGREELLRASEVGVQLVRLRETLMRPPRAAGPRAQVLELRRSIHTGEFKRLYGGEVEQLPGRSTGKKSGSAAARIRLAQVAARAVRLGNAGTSPSAHRDIENMLARNRRSAGAALGGLGVELDHLSAAWETYKFDLHERDGLLPLARALGQVRRRAGVVRSQPTVIVAKPEPPDEPRFVNADLWSEDDEGMLVALPQRSARLRVGDLYHLAVQIGPHSVVVQTIDATALIEEKFKWTPMSNGTWVEVGITGLDFDVVGYPVQELWLPRRGASEPAYFAVVPRTAGVARLRFALFFQQDVMQSFRLAALTYSEQRREPPVSVRKRRLAQALGLPIGKLRETGGVGFLSRLEYAVSTDLTPTKSHQPRALSIIANDANGRSVITVKGADAYGVTTDDDLPRHVTAVRAALQEAATPNARNLDPRFWNYRFASSGKNAGTDASLSDALGPLALAGWQLFDKIIPVSERDKIATALEPDRQVIRVAHVLLEKVIPWAALYDRPYFPNRRTYQGKPVTRATCLAALPGADGRLPATTCGAVASCVLHPSQVAAREAARTPMLVAETVICPLHFWGFKHVIEVPPQQSVESKAPPPLCEKIPSGKLPQLGGGLNDGLKLAGEHRATMTALAGTPATASWKFWESIGDELLDKLAEESLDVIYLYCHARGGTADPDIYPPCLEFETGANRLARQITSDEFTSKAPWAHNPLVFLNGCGTVAFSPDALSPFVQKLVNGLGASGVVGTEISVWEDFATEFAESFLKQFLARRTAGEAIVDARRALLAKRNPLGLAYTLYASAGLRLV